MKNILIFILAVFSITAVTAQTKRLIDRYEVENKQGGKIVLERTVCKNHRTGEVFVGAWSSYYYLKDGTTGTGCWGFKDKRVKVIWEDGTAYMYNPADFTAIYK